eukprot:scaffold87918_cov18-Prasinocladus_malaysianus.AAC.1
MPPRNPQVACLMLPVKSAASRRSACGQLKSCAKGKALGRILHHHAACTTLSVVRAGGLLRSSLLLRRSPGTPTNRIMNNER